MLLSFPFYIYIITMKLVLFVALVVLCGFAVADVFSQLQFMKIISPTSGQTVAAGDKLTIKYAMQPLVYSKSPILMMALSNF